MRSRTQHEEVPYQCDRGPNMTKFHTTAIEDPTWRSSIPMQSRTQHDEVPCPCIDQTIVSQLTSTEIYSKRLTIWHKKSPTKFLSPFTILWDITGTQTEHNNWDKHLCLEIEWVPDIMKHIIWTPEKWVNMHMNTRPNHNQNFPSTSIVYVVCIYKHKLLTQSYSITY